MTTRSVDIYALVDVAGPSYTCRHAWLVVSHGGRRLAGDKPQGAQAWLDYGYKHREAVYRLHIYSIGHRQLLAYVRYMC